MNKWKSTKLIEHKKSPSWLMKSIFGCHRVSPIIICVPRTGLESACPFGHRPLKTARLPISPPGQVVRLAKGAQSSYDNLVIPPGFEPGTLWLKVRCSASWATGSIWALNKINCEARRHRTENYEILTIYSKSFGLKVRWDCTIRFGIKRGEINTFRLCKSLKTTISTRPKCFHWPPE